MAPSRCATRRRASASTARRSWASSAMRPTASTAAQGQGGFVSIRFAVADHVARVTIDRPDRMNAIDEASEAELMRIWEAIERDRRRALRRAHRRRRARLLHRRRHEAERQQDRAGILGRGAARRLRRPRVARHARRAGDRAGERPRAGRRHGDGARLRHRRRRRQGDASACPSRASAGWRSTAASRCCRAASRMSRPWACC